jgi:hypothetical protein
MEARGMNEQEIIANMRDKIKRLIAKGDELFGQMEDIEYQIDWHGTFPANSWQENRAAWKKAMKEWEAEATEWDSE